MRLMISNTCLLLVVLLLVEASSSSELTLEQEKEKLCIENIMFQFDTFVKTYGIAPEHITLLDFDIKIGKKPRGYSEDQYNDDANRLRDTINKGSRNALGSKWNTVHRAIYLQSFNNKIPSSLRMYLLGMPMPVVFEAQTGCTEMIYGQKRIKNSL